jgi:hypothetical protein
MLGADFFTDPSLAGLCRLPMNNQADSIRMVKNINATLFSFCYPEITLGIIRIFLVRFGNRLNVPRSAMPIWRYLRV